jgi:hypothetical protein
MASSLHDLMFKYKDSAEMKARMKKAPSGYNIPPEAFTSAPSGKSFS